MSSLILRFRDLNIPDGQTIHRHRAKIHSHGCVWWGWMKRQRSEIFPEKLLLETADALSAHGAQEVFLYDSGECSLHRAVMRDVVAYPGGVPIQTPEVHKTPTYMAEAECPAWFLLTEVGDPIGGRAEVTISHFPTLKQLAAVDRELEAQPFEDLDKLGFSSATLWQGAVRVT